METNFEHYKDEFLKSFIINNSRCIFIKKYILHIDNCNDIHCADCSAKIKKWLDEEYKEPKLETDWTKVPANTPVYVWDDLSVSKAIKHFASYDSVAKDHFLCYTQGKTSWTTTETIGWKYCELANEEDKIKYAKGDEK